MIKNKNALWIAMGILLGCSPAYSQSFGDEIGITLPEETPVVTPSSTQEKISDPIDEESSEEENVTPQEQQPKPFFMPGQQRGQSQPEVIQSQQPTLDGSRRGDVNVKRILEPGEQPDPNEDDRLIFLFYRGFNVQRMAGGRVECTMTFVALTTLDNQLANLSVKLKWPEISTSLNFIDVSPNIQTAFTYTLVGEGCYTMDKIPNIIVNRCRVKGMSQRDCAAKIRWLKV